MDLILFRPHPRHGAVVGCGSRNIWPERGCHVEPGLYLVRDLRPTPRGTAYVASGLERWPEKPSLELCIKHGSLRVDWPTAHAVFYFTPWAMPEQILSRFPLGRDLLQTLRESGRFSPLVLDPISVHLVHAPYDGEREVTYEGKRWRLRPGKEPCQIFASIGSHRDDESLTSAWAWFDGMAAAVEQALDAALIPVAPKGFGSCDTPEDRAWTRSSLREVAQAEVWALITNNYDISASLVHSWQFREFVEKYATNLARCPFCRDHKVADPIPVIVRQLPERWYRLPDGRFFFRSKALFGYAPNNPELKEALHKAR